ncbi:hypothetical protein ABTX35_33535, partial [Streptomyces sp. NPDC096080]
MSSEHTRRWESGALAHAVNDPFGQGPLPWLRGGETYFGDTGRVVPWYVDADRGTAPPEGDPHTPGGDPHAPGPRPAEPAPGGGGGAARRGADPHGAGGGRGGTTRPGGRPA